MPIERAQEKPLSIDSLSNQFSLAVQGALDENHPVWIGIKLAIAQTSFSGFGQSIPIGCLRFLSISEIKALGKAKKENESNFTNLLLKLSTDRAIERVREIIAFHQEQMELLLERLTEAEDFLELLREYDKALEEVIEEYRDTGNVDFIQPGQLKDDKADEALQAYIKEHQINLADGNTDIYLLLLNVRADIQQQIEHTDNQIKIDTDAFEIHQFDWQEAENIKQLLESGNEEQQLKALNTLEGLEKDMKIAITLNLEKDTNYEMVTDEFEEPILLQTEDLAPIDLLSDLEEKDEPVSNKSAPKL